MNRVRVRIPSASLMPYLLGKRRLVNIPADAKLIAIRVDTAWTDSVEEASHLALILEHPSFPGLTPIGRIPRLKLRYRETA